VNTLSAVLGFAVLLKSGVDLVERKTDLLKKEVRTEKVDFGGMLVYLGDCWSIGYRNGKEGFGDDQKYIHEFGVDEETGRTFEEPKLYMTVPDQGKPMLVIKDGAWKIKTDKNGVSWIYY
jgi:hypothetical protein